MSPIAESEALRFNSKHLLSTNTVLTSPRPNMIDIIDVRRDQSRIQTSLKDDILSMLGPEKGPKTMPTVLLYNGRGLQLFEEVRMMK